VFWSHLHPAIIHFVVGLVVVVLLWDIRRLRKISSGELVDPAFLAILEGGVLLALLGVGTGWIALAHDTIVQHGGIPLPLGQVHGKMGVSLLALTTFRALGGASPGTVRLRRLWMGVDLALLLLLSGTALLGEWLVFHEGMGLDELIYQSF